jgi:uncharacterized damage-inducible protein DinB
MDLLDRLLGHDRWTTNHLLDLSSGLSGAQLDQEFDIGHRTLRRTFDHMNLATEFWTGFMIGKPIPWEPALPSLPEVRERHERVYDQFAQVARQLHTDQRLDETFVDHYDYPQSYGATILHVILHNQQHRSEVLHILQRLDVPNVPEADPQEWEHMTGIL